MSKFLTLINKIFKHWLFLVVISTLPIYWFFICQVFGFELKLIDYNAKLTDNAKVILWITFIISGIFTFLKYFLQHKNNIRDMYGKLLFIELINSIDSVVEKKGQRFIEYIDSVSDNSIQANDKRANNIFSSITQPKIQIENLLEKMIASFSYIFGVSHDNIGLSIIYKYDTEDAWKWYALKNLDNDEDMSLNTILDNKETCLGQIINSDGRIKCIFFPDKRTGLKKKQYVMGKKDEKFDCIGSIICKDISVAGKNNHKYVHAILTLTSYGTQICGENDKNAKDEILNFIIPLFEKRIKLELSLAYIKDVKDTLVST